MKNVIKIDKINYKILSLCISFGIICVFLLFQYQTVQYGDAYGYRMMAESFIEQGMFNFQPELETGSELQLLFSVRAYGWPWIIALFKILGFNTRIGFLFWWGIFLSLGLAYVIPEIFESLFHKKIGIFARIAPTVLTIFFWPGLVIYLLSDIPATVFVGLGILLLLKARNIHSRWNYAVFLLAGFIFQFSYYIRTGSNTSLLIALIIILIYFRKEKRLIALLMSFALGMVIAMTPQIILNEACNGRASYEVPINFTTGIVNQEYYSGVSHFRYETIILNQYGMAMVSDDGLVDSMLKNENINSIEMKPKDLVKMTITYPFEFLGLFMTKAINYMDARYGEVYVKNVYPFRYIPILLNFIIWFLAAAGGMFQLKHVRVQSGEKVKNQEVANLIYFIKNYFLYIVAFISPALLHIGGTHVEPRYIFPIYILVWLFVFGICPLKELLICLSHRIVSTVLIFVLSFSGCWAVWNLTFQEFPDAAVFYQENPEVYQEERLALDQANTNSEDTIVVLNTFDFQDMRMEFLAQAFIKNMDSKETKVSVILRKEDKDYLFKVNTGERIDVVNTYGSEKYLNSGVYFSRNLWDLDEGTYELIFYLENGAEKRIVNTGQKITIER